jgi:hypothetical protein
MLFFEASAKTGHNIEQVFEQSAIEIARKIEENCYDLNNESCGIKIGVNNESLGGNIKLNKQTKNSDSKKSVFKTTCNEFIHFNSFNKNSTRHSNSSNKNSHIEFLFLLIRQ